MRALVVGCGLRGVSVSRIPSSGRPPVFAGPVRPARRLWSPAAPQRGKGAGVSQATAVSELERTKGTRLLNRNIA